MPGRKGENPPETEVIKIRIPVKTKEECLEAKGAGVHWHKAESSFFGYLLELGLRKYQRDYLPEELQAPMSPHATYQGQDVWVNEELEKYNFGIIGGIGSRVKVEAERAKAEDAGYKRMSYQQYKEECLRKFGTESPPPQRPKYVLGKGVWDGEPA